MIINFKVFATRQQSISCFDKIERVRTHAKFSCNKRKSEREADSGDRSERERDSERV